MRKLVLSFFVFFFLFTSCNNTNQSQEKEQFDQNKLKQQLEEVQKPAIVMENDIIYSYTQRHNLEMKTTGSGLRYLIINENPKGRRAKSMDVVTVAYSISLLNGTFCYKGIKDFKVDEDHVEKGVHEGIKLLREKEQAIFILPSHLAHGLSGDNNKIPPKAILICEVELRKVDSK